MKYRDIYGRITAGKRIAEQSFPAGIVPVLYVAVALTAEKVCVSAHFCFTVKNNSKSSRKEEPIKLTVKHFSELSAEKLFEVYKLLVSVFVVEQKCPYQEADDADRAAYHL